MIDTTRYTNLIGHTHNDKLSVELMVDGNYIVRDPGGYVYTAAPEIRNIFRGTKAHNTIYVTGTEQNDFNGTFGMKKSQSILVGMYRRKNRCKRELCRA